MQESLPLFGTARQISGDAVLGHLGQVTLHCFPSMDLTVIIIGAPAHKITAVPLEPSPWIIGMNPSLREPDRKRLRSIDVKIIQRGIMPLRA